MDQQPKKQNKKSGLLGCALAGAVLKSPKDPDRIEKGRSRNTTAFFSPMTIIKISKVKKFPLSYYEEYLNSLEWKERRSQKLKKNPFCFMCGKKATQVHHITYERLGKEKDSDLVSVCGKHHRKIHFKNLNKKDKRTYSQSLDKYQQYYHIGRIRRGEIQSNRKKRIPWYKTKEKIKAKFNCRERYSKHLYYGPNSRDG